MGVKMRHMRTANLGVLLREARSRKRLSQKTVADAAGIAQTYYSEIERGVKEPERDVVKRLAASLDISEAHALFAAGFLPSNAQEIAITDEEAELLNLYRASTQQKRVLGVVKELLKDYEAVA